MNPEQIIPAAPNPSPLYGPPVKPQATSRYLLVATVVFALGTIVFGVMAALYANQASNTRNTADAMRAQAVANAKEQQKAEDEAAATKAAGLPYRSYTAPVAYGSFQVFFPKDWSSYVEEQPSGTQVFMRLNPQFIRRTNSVNEKDAVHVSLINQTSDNFMRQFENSVRTGTIKKTIITVSAQPAFNLTGTFSDKRTVREVVVPVRDKIIVFTTEDAKYAAEFNEIIAQAKIIP